VEKFQNKNNRTFSILARHKMSISGRKIEAGGNWKSLQISSQLLEQGLLGIEELSDYSLKKIRKKKKILKEDKDLEKTELVCWKYFLLVTCQLINTGTPFKLIALCLTTIIRRAKFSSPNFTSPLLLAPSHLIRYFSSKFFFTSYYLLKMLGSWVILSTCYCVNHSKEGPNQGILWKGKDRYGWPPYINLFRSTTFSSERILSFYKTSC